MMPVGKPQQVSRSHSNTTSLMHAGPVQTTEWPSLRQQRANTNKRHQRRLCLYELAGYKACRCAAANKDTNTHNTFIHSLDEKLNYRQEVCNFMARTTGYEGMGSNQRVGNDN